MTLIRASKFPKFRHEADLLVAVVLKIRFEHRAAGMLLVWDRGRSVLGSTPSKKGRFRSHQTQKILTRL
jgi:hypothetical protein